MKQLLNYSIAGLMVVGVGLAQDQSSSPAAQTSSPMNQSTMRSGSMQRQRGGSMQSNWQQYTGYLVNTGCGALSSIPRNSVMAANTPAPAGTVDMIIIEEQRVGPAGSMPAGTNRAGNQPGVSNYQTDNAGAYETRRGSVAGATTDAGMPSATQMGRVTQPMTQASMASQTANSTNPYYATNNRGANNSNARQTTAMSQDQSGYGNMNRNTGQSMNNQTMASRTSGDMAAQSATGMAQDAAQYAAAMQPPAGCTADANTTSFGIYAHGILMPFDNTSNSNFMRVAQQNEKMRNKLQSSSQAILMTATGNWDGSALHVHSIHRGPAQ